MAFSLLLVTKIKECTGNKLHYKYLNGALGLKAPEIFEGVLGLEKVTGDIVCLALPLDGVDVALFGVLTGLEKTCAPLKYDATIEMIHKYIYAKVMLSHLIVCALLLCVSLI